MVIRKKTFNGFFKIESECVHALQLIKSNHDNLFELNLVLKDGNRANLISCLLGRRNESYAEQERIRNDAERLAAFLEKPLWEKGTLS
ncbi:MAG: hypothetical protein D3924_11800 [Candidatus Electrothrix sp. AR4]|nr:hypothetical protein [Candidatus Electrothrix sp. AR4]